MPKERRGFFSSFQYVTLISGQLIALGVLIVLQQTLTTEQLYAWGWRIPFVIGALCAVVALFLRRGMEETESFTRKEKAKESLMRTLMRHPKELMTVVGLTMGGTLAFYTYTTYMQKYLVNTVGMSITDSTSISAATLFLFMLLQPVIGALSDKVGRRPILIACAGCRPAVCTHGVDFRRYCGIHRTVIQEHRHGNRLLLVRNRVHRLFAAGVCLHERHAPTFAHRDRLIALD